LRTRILPRNATKKERTKLSDGVNAKVRV